MSFKVTTLLSLLLFHTSAHSQFMNVPSTIRTPYGNVKTGVPVYVGNRYYGNWKNPKSTDAYTIKVIFASDSVAKIEGRIVTSESSSVIVIDSLTAISPAETKEITCTAPGMKKVKGYPTATGWQFQLTSGSVRAYSNVPFNEEGIVSLQKGEGEIVPFTKEDLLEWIGISVKIVDIIEKGKYVQAIRQYNSQM